MAKSVAFGKRGGSNSRPGNRAGRNYRCPRYNVVRLLTFKTGKPVTKFAFVLKRRRRAPHGRNTTNAILDETSKRFDNNFRASSHDANRVRSCEIPRRITLYNRAFFGRKLRKRNFTLPRSVKRFGRSALKIVSFELNRHRSFSFDTVGIPKQRNISVVFCSFSREIHRARFRPVNDAFTFLTPRQ